MIPQETVDQIMNAAVIEEVVGDYVELKKSGSALARVESVHQRERPRRFTCLPAKGIFKCFSSGKRAEACGHFFDGARKGQLP